MGGGEEKGDIFQVELLYFKGFFFSFFASLECGGIYKEASHCWPFSTSFKKVVSKDLKGDRQASLKVSRIFL